MQHFFTKVERVKYGIALLVETTKDVILIKDQHLSTL